MEQTLNYKKFEVSITYLEMVSRPTKPLPPMPPYKAAIMRVKNCTAGFYRFVYDMVGRRWFWVIRRYMSDQELLSIIQDEDVYLYCLYIEGVPAGIAEIDSREKKSKGSVELKYFGLGEAFIGKGLGKWFLANAIDLAWSLEPGKLTLETCTADHPAALSLYQKMGFTPCGQGNGIIEWRG